MTKISILHYAAPPVVGGVESTIEHHARLLAERGYQVSVIAGRGERFNPAVEFTALEDVDSRIQPVEAVNRELAEGNVSTAFFTLRDRLVQSLEPLLVRSDAVIVHNALTLHKNLALTAALHQLSQAGEMSWIAWCHDFAWQDPIYTPGLHAGYPWDLLRTAWPGIRYVVVSDHRRQQLAELLQIPAHNIELIPPGVEPYSFLGISAPVRRLADRLGLLQADPLLLLPARITRRKNIEFALQVMAELRKIKPHALLVVTGPPGPHNPANAAYLDSLQELRESLQLNRNICFLYEQGEGGEPLNLSDAEIAELYRLADLLFFPSRREGFGIPVLEAGLARLPVFAADIPPVHESAAGQAHVFPLDADPADVARRIAQFIDTDPAVMLRRRVITHFTWSSIIEHQLIPLIEEVTRR